MLSLLLDEQISPQAAAALRALRLWWDMRGDWDWTNRIAYLRPVPAPH